MKTIWKTGGREGVRLEVYPDGIYISGWYDSFVEIEGAFVTWEELEDMRKAARKKKPFIRSKMTTKRQRLDER